MIDGVLIGEPREVSRARKIPREVVTSPDGQVRAGTTAHPGLRTEGRMPEPVLFILVMHSIAGIVTLIIAIRERPDFLSWLRWGVVGFVTGLLGLVMRWRVDRQQLSYMQVFQDAFLNLVLEVIAVVVMPRFLK